MKLTTSDLAFTLESIVHLKFETDPAIKKYAAHMLLAALIVRDATDEQLAAALEKQMNSPFYGANLDVPQPIGS